MHQCIQTILQNKWKKGSIPPLWDGNTANRIIDAIQKIYTPTTALKQPITAS